MTVRKKVTDLASGLYRYLCPKSVISVIALIISLGNLFYINAQTNLLQSQSNVMLCEKEIEQKKILYEAKSKLLKLRTEQEKLARNISPKNMIAYRYEIIDLVDEVEIFTTLHFGEFYTQVLGERTLFTTSGRRVRVIMKATNSALKKGANEQKITTTLHSYDYYKSAVIDSFNEIIRLDKKNFALVKFNASKTQEAYEGIEKNLNRELEKIEKHCKSPMRS